jgi:hypothetical protein
MATVVSRHCVGLWRQTLHRIAFNIAVAQLPQAVVHGNDAAGMKDYGVVDEIA